MDGRSLPTSLLTIVPSHFVGIYLSFGKTSDSDHALVVGDAGKSFAYLDAQKQKTDTDQKSARGGGKVEHALA